MLTRSISSRNSRIEHVFVEPSVQRHPSNKTPGAAGKPRRSLIFFSALRVCQLRAEPFAQVSRTAGHDPLAPPLARIEAASQKNPPKREFARVAGGQPRRSDNYAKESRVPAEEMPLVRGGARSCGNSLARVASLASLEGPSTVRWNRLSRAVARTG
jgi:hypothetical protein